MNIKLTRTRVVLATAVLGIAVAGVSYAAIPAANGTISACKDSKGSLKVIDAESGQDCPGNQQLLTWSQQGPAGQNGVSGREIAYAVSAYDSSIEKSAVATCPSGKVPVGGGGGIGMYSGPSYLTPDGVALVLSRPDGNGWDVVAHEIVPTDQLWELTGWVVCVNAG